MKVLWVGDAVVPSGFARCTHAACDQLHAEGHEVAVLGINYRGDPHPYPYNIYPCINPIANGHDGFGNTRLPHMIHELSPDVVVFLNDPWNIPNYLVSLQAKLDDSFPLPKLVGWLAVDGANQQGFGCNDLDLIVTWTKYAQRELAAGGYTGPFEQVTLGVNHDDYYPIDRVEARKYLGPLQEVVGDAFLVGAIGRNQIRKRLDLTIQYFADWYHRYNPNAFLYLHVGPTGDVGFDLNSLTRYYNVKDRVIIGRPILGVGASEAVMRMVYSMLDLYITTTQGEGFGLPALEAMACGVPCIVPDWSALGEWPGDAAVRVPCDTTAMTAPTNGLLHTIGGVPNRREFVNAMAAMCQSSIHRDTYIRRGLRLASSLRWEDTGKNFARVLNSLPESAPRTVADLGKERKPVEAQGVQEATAANG